MKKTMLVVSLFLVAVVMSVVGAAEKANVGLLVTMGHKPEKPMCFDGSVSVSHGEVVKLESPWFERGDEIVSNTEWKCSTRMPLEKKLRPDQIASMEFLGRKKRASKPLINRLFIYLNCPESAQVHIKTASGELSLKLADVPYGKRLFSGNGLLAVERVPVVDRLTDEPLYDDYGSIVVDRDGNEWVAWTSYNDEKEEDYVHAAVYRAGSWGKPWRLTSGGTDVFQTAIAQDAQGRIWIVWSERARKPGDFLGSLFGAPRQNWDLFARYIHNNRPSKLFRLTTNPAPDIYHKLISDNKGRLILVWQGFREGQSDIFMRILDGDSWSDEIRMSESPANDWQPSVAVDSTGKIYAAWDSYRDGNYDICLRSFTDGTLSPLKMVTNTLRREAHVTLAVDKQDCLWLAWEEAPEGWGKDTGFTLNKAYTGEEPKRFGCGLHARKGPTIVYVKGDRLLRPAAILYEEQPWLRRLCEYPIIAFDGEGRLWLFFRRLERKMLKGTPRGIWHTYAVFYSGDSWSSDVLLPHTSGRQDMQISLAAGAKGDGFHLAWSSDERSWADPNPKNNNIYVTGISTTGLPLAVPALVEYEPAPETPVAVAHPNEDKDVERCRTFVARVGGKEYRLVRGDTHRHTDISADGLGDSSQYDMYRYALDASNLDWISIGDHDNGWGPGQCYAWWRTQKACDVFLVGNRFVPLFGYERSCGWPHGHRNVTAAERGIRVVQRIFDEKGKGPRRRLSDNDTKNLYKELRKSGSICFSHTSGTSGMGTDWRDNDPEVEPVVEIFQGCRTSYEYPGAPKAATADEVRTQAGGFAAAGYVWEAWKEGLRLGVISSSDHGSTHMSYASIWVEDFARESIVEAIKARHCFGATDNIIMTFTMDDKHFMGDEFNTDRVPVIKASVLGTNEIKVIDLVKNNQFIHKVNPSGKDFEFTFRDEDLQPGTSYYYVRVEQEDGQLAWSSPIWVNYRAK